MYQQPHQQPVYQQPHQQPVYQQSTARSRSNDGVISKYITGTDRRSCLSRTFHTGYRVKYPFFAEDDCMVRIVIIPARHSAKIRAKSLIVSEKAILIIVHLCREPAVSGQKSYLPASLIDSILKLEHAVHSYLRIRTTAHTEYAWLYC
jgi:hypothetical protein